jgi:hypothetical protein
LARRAWRYLANFMVSPMRFAGHVDFTHLDDVSPVLTTSRASVQTCGSAG